MADFHSLGRTLTVYAAQVGRHPQATQRKATKALARELILGTPVDVGTARSNWQVGTTPGASPRGAYAPGSKLGIGEGQNAAAAIAAAYAAVDATPTGADLYVSNPLDYIDELDKGHSRQAPPGLVKRALAVARQEVRRIKIFGNDRP